MKDEYNQTGLASDYHGGVSIGNHRPGILAHRQVPSIWSVRLYHYLGCIRTLQDSL